MLEVAAAQWNVLETTGRVTPDSISPLSGFLENVSEIIPVISVSFLLSSLF